MVAVGVIGVIFGYVSCPTLSHWFVLPYGVNCGYNRSQPEDADRAK